MRKIVFIVLAFFAIASSMAQKHVPDGFYRFLFRHWQTDSTLWRGDRYQYVYRSVGEDGKPLYHPDYATEVYRVFDKESDFVYDIALYGTQSYQEGMVYFRIWWVDTNAIHYLDEEKDADSTAFDAINIYDISDGSFHVKWLNPMAHEWFEDSTIAESVWEEEPWHKVRPPYEALILRDILENKVQYADEKGETMKGWWSYKEFSYIDRDGKAVVQPQEEGKYTKYFGDNYQVNLILTGRDAPEWDAEGYIKPIEYNSKEGNVELIKEADNLSLFRLSGRQHQLTYYSNNGFIVHELWERR